MTAEYQEKKGTSRLFYAGMAVVTGLFIISSYRAYNSTEKEERVQLSALEKSVDETPRTDLHR